MYVYKNNQSACAIKSESPNSSELTLSIDDAWQQVGDILKEGVAYQKDFVIEEIYKVVQSSEEFRQQNPALNDYEGIRSFVKGYYDEVNKGQQVKLSDCERQTTEKVLLSGAPNSAQLPDLEHLDERDIVEVAFLDPPSLSSEQVPAASKNKVITGHGWFRPEGHEYVVGRKNTFVPDGQGIGKFIDNFVPAGHTFGANHDAYVGMMTSLGVPDLLVNIPSMFSMYVLSFVQETINSVTASTLFGYDYGVPFIHEDLK